LILFSLQEHIRKDNLDNIYLWKTYIIIEKYENTKLLKYF